MVETAKKRLKFLRRAMLPSSVPSRSEHLWSFYSYTRMSFCILQFTSSSIYALRRRHYTERRMKSMQNIFLAHKNNKFNLSTFLIATREVNES